MSAVLSLPIDKASPVPLYYQLAQAVENAIRSGVLEPGAKLESETHLATRLHTTRPTVNKALNQLVETGLLVRKEGGGTYVTPTDLRRSPRQPTPRSFGNRRPNTPPKNSSSRERRGGLEFC